MMMMMRRNQGGGAGGGGMYQGGGYSVEAHLVPHPPELDPLSPGVPSEKPLAGCLAGERRTGIIIAMGVVATALFCCCVAGAILYIYCELVEFE